MKLKNRPYEFFLLALGTLMSIGAIVYRLYALNILGVTTTLILSVIIFSVLKYFSCRHHEQGEHRIRLELETEKANSKEKWLYALFYATTIGATAYGIYLGRNDAARISPWSDIPSWIFLTYALSNIILLKLLTVWRYLAKPFLTAHTLFSFSIAVFAYRLGFGFDPFIHQATLELIDKHGLVEPKPLYYLGQYALIIVSHKTLGLSIGFLSKWLLPIIASLLLPISLWRFLSIDHDRSVAGIWTIVALLSIPFSIFTISTPQNLAYLLLIIIVLEGAIARDWLGLFVIYALSLATIVTQPLAGMPACFFALTLTLFHSDYGRKRKTWLYGLFSIAAAIAVPLAFYIIGKRLGASLDMQNGWQVISKLSPTWTASESPWWDAIYLYGKNLSLVIGGMLTYGAWQVIKRRDNCSILGVHALMSLSSLLAFLLSGFISFSYLISYERGDFQMRLLIVALIFALPFFLASFYALAQRIERLSFRHKMLYAILTSALISTSLYLSYPRFDPYHNSRGYSSGRFDFEAVDWIDQDADGRDYIVLANQQVSAAALSRHGFRKYYQGDIFYYPIPTGGPLYQYYLDMVYKKATRDTMNQAMDLAGVKTAYFVLNKYWWASPKILAEAKLSADGWTQLGSGDVTIFRFVRK